MKNHIRISNSGRDKRSRGVRLRIGLLCGVHRNGRTGTSTLNGILSRSNRIHCLSTATLEDQRDFLRFSTIKMESVGRPSRCHDNCKFRGGDDSATRQVRIGKVALARTGVELAVQCTSGGHNVGPSPPVAGKFVRRRQINEARGLIAI